MIAMKSSTSIRGASPIGSIGNSRSEGVDDAVFPLLGKPVAGGNGRDVKKFGNREKALKSAGRILPETTARWCWRLS